MTAAHRLFLYGTLRDPELLGIVAGDGVVEERAATLPDHAVFWVQGESFPIIVEAPGGVARGLLISVTKTARRRLDFYEIGFGYGVETRVIETDAGAVEATVYIPPAEMWEPGDAWSLADWQEVDGPLAREAARDYMALIDTHDPEAAARAFSQIRSRAASRLRARAAPSPVAFDDGPGEVRSERTAQPYVDYFAVREDWLRVPRFGGGLGPVVKRASFLGGDAVTVLPYDPATGRVLVIRQFRHGAFARGDTNPWCIEPPAGRIDPGETPHDAAMRELREETGLEARRLLRVASYYPTPGAFSEHLTSYVAICDLEGRDGQVNGVETEHEDIMSHVVALDELAEMIESGAANTGPLVMSAQWLLLRRDSLH